MAFYWLVNQKSAGMNPRKKYILRNTKSLIVIDNIPMKETMSQILNICLSFYFMKYRKFIQKKSTKFVQLIHGYLKLNVIKRLLKF